MLASMEEAFAELRADMRPPKEEISHMLDLLWRRGPQAGKQGDSLKQLVQLTRFGCLPIRLQTPAPRSIRLPPLDGTATCPAQ